MKVTLKLIRHNCKQSLTILAQLHVTIQFTKQNLICDMEYSVLNHADLWWSFHEQHFRIFRASVTCIFQRNDVGILCRSIGGSNCLLHSRPCCQLSLHLCSMDSINSLHAIPNLTSLGLRFQQCSSVRLGLKFVTIVII